MSIGLTEEHRALAASVRAWAESADMPGLCKDSESQGVKVFESVWAELGELGVPGIALSSDHGGAGGSLVDLAVAIEACAAAMVPGPLTPTAVATTVLAESPETPDGLLVGVAGGTVSIGLGLGTSTVVVEDGYARGEARLVWGAGMATHLLLPTAPGPVLGSAESAGAGFGGWLVLPVERADVAPEIEVAPTLDLSSRVGRVVLSGVPAEPTQLVRLDPERLWHVALTLVAAEAAGLARWALDTAVAYAGVREQFGRPIGSFQAVKHLCAEMLEDVEAATAVAWDAASAHGEGPAQHAIAAVTAGVVAVDAAVRTTQRAVQVLGGIGFTWEHDAHLYLRRAMGNRQLIGGTDRWRRELTSLAAGGVRRVVHLDLGDEAAAVRREVRPLVDEVVDAPPQERRRALVEAGLLMPHWPRPYGRDADAVEQLVIDEELRAAGIDRPGLGIGAWAAPTIIEHGSAKQRERFLGPTLLGELSWCQLFSEPAAGSDLAALRTRAEPTEGGWLLTGQKVWTSLASQANWGICLARTNREAPKHRGISYFLVDMTSPGIEIRPLRELTGDELFNEVFLDRVFVPEDCLVGEVDGGWPLARTTLANERVAIGDSSFGVSVERVLRVVEEQRSDPRASPDAQSWGRGSGTLDPAMALRVGEAVATAGAVRALGLRSTLRSVEGHEPGPESSVLKLAGVQQRQDSAELALEVLGEEVLLGTGEGPAALHEALVTRCLSIAGGTTQVLRNIAAERILGLPRD